MFDRDRWQEIFHVLSANKLRTALTAFGVFWGIFMMIIMVGSGNGLKNGVTRDMGGVAMNSSFMWTQSTGIPYKGLPKGRYFNFKNEDIQAIERQIPEVEAVAPRNSLGGWQGSNNVVRGLKTGAFSIFGDEPDFFRVKPIVLLDGRLLNDNDLAEKRKVCVIGMRVKEMLFDAGEEVIGESIQVNGVYFTVVGVLRSKQKGENGDEENQSLFIPFTTFQKAFNYGDIVGWFAFLAKEDQDVVQVEAKVKKFLMARHKIHPDDSRAIGSWNMATEFRQVSGLFTGIKWLSFVVGFFTLLAGAIGVSNIMLVIVKERTKEIGIRRALGATPLNIFSQILSESAFLTLIAGIAGVLAGVWSLEGISSIIESTGGGGSFTKPGVDLQLILASLGILIIIGLCAGMIPARKAISVKPITALRDE